MSGPPVPGASCPHCGRQADGASQAYGTDALPSPGDFAICAYCCGVNEYSMRGGMLGLIKADLTVLDDATRGQLLSAQATIIAAHRRR